MLNSNKHSGKVLGLDYGSVRIGVAISDVTGTIAFGKTVVKNEPSCFGAILEIVKNENVKKIVLGYPFNLKGKKSAQTNRVEEFKNNLHDFLKKVRIDVDIITWDERFSSKIASESLLISGMKKNKREDKSIIDIISATLILQSYLDSKR